VGGVRFYVQLISINIRSQLQYRTSFFLMAAGNFMISIADFLAVWVLFSRFSLLRGWRLPEIALLYGLISTSFAFSEAFARGFDVFGQQVQSGEFDRMLCRNGPIPWDRHPGCSGSRPWRAPSSVWPHSASGAGESANTDPRGVKIDGP